MVLKDVAKIVIAVGEAVGKAFSRAVREEYIASKHAAQNQQSTSSSKSSAEEATKVNAKMGITLQESLQILDISPPIDKSKVEERYKHLFEINDKSKGGSLYLQSKIFRAKERIDQELLNAELKQKNRQDFNL